MADNIGVTLLLPIRHHVEVLDVAVAATTSTTLDDSRQEFPTAQIEDKLVFKGEEMSWPQIMGRRPT
jgi:hypothetical protein